LFQQPTSICFPIVVSLYTLNSFEYPIPHRWCNG